MASKRVFARMNKEPMIWMVRIRNLPGVRFFRGERRGIRANRRRNGCWTAIRPSAYSSGTLAGVGPKYETGAR